MKVFVATDKGDWLDSDVLECENDEIVIFPLFQSLYNINKDEIYMQGITTKKVTTTVTIKNLKIPFDYYKELIKESIESEHKIYIDDDGYFKVNDVRFDLNEIIDELIDKCNEFKIGDIIKIDGKQLYAF
jgi:hypothetical protein